MFERFNDKALKSVMLAQEEARRLGHNVVGIEMILLGLIGENTSEAARALKSMGVNLRDARIEVEKIIGRGSGLVGVEIRFTPRAKRLLSHAWYESHKWDSRRIVRPGHVLLGLIAEAEVCALQEPKGVKGAAHRVLVSLGVDLDSLRKEVLEGLGPTLEHRKNDRQSASQDAASTTVNFKGFTEASMKAMMVAQDETHRLNHILVGSETILLGLISADGLASLVLKAVDVHFERAQSEVERITSRGAGAPLIELPLPFTPRASRILKLSRVIARQLEHDYVSTKHLLLGLIDESDNSVAGGGVLVLANCGVDLANLRVKTLDMSESLSVHDMSSAAPNDP